MVEIDIAGDSLVVQVRGADRLWALKSELTIPLVHVTGVRRAGEDAHAKLATLKTTGTLIPGLAAGRFHLDGKHVFMDVHDPTQAIEIGLEDERFDKLVVEVSDPQDEITKISRALGQDVS